VCLWCLSGLCKNTRMCAHVCVGKEACQGVYVVVCARVVVVVLVVLVVWWVVCAVYVCTRGELGALGSNVSARASGARWGVREPFRL
jgi:hypothetical protein